MIALLTSPVGKTTLKLPEEADLSAPKSKTATAGLVRLELSTSLALGVLLYIKAPLAVSVTLEKVSSSKSIKAVVPLVFGNLGDEVTLVKLLPPEV